MGQLRPWSHLSTYFPLHVLKDQMLVWQLKPGNSVLEAVKV